MMILQFIGVIYLVLNVFVCIIAPYQIEKSNHRLKDITYLQLIFAIIFLPSVLIAIFFVVLGSMIDFIIDLKIWKMLNVKIIKDKED